MMKTTTDSILELGRKYAVDVIEGLNYSVTPFHAVDYCRRKLLENGFKELNEK